MKLPDLDQKKLAAIAAGAIFLMAATYLVFLAATWVQFQADRNNRMEKIDELLDRLPQPGSNDGGHQEVAEPGKVLRLRDTDQVPAPNHSDPVRDPASAILRTLSQQTPPTPHGTD